LICEDWSSTITKFIPQACDSDDQHFQSEQESGQEKSVWDVKVERREPKPKPSPSKMISALIR
jgi:hypothetical protein